MTKEKCVTVFPSVTVFPKTILVKMQQDDDGDESFLLAASTASELGDADGAVARYVLAGIGVIKYAAPTYVEDEKA